MWWSRRVHLGKSVWAVGDQGLSSATNAALTFFVARETTATMLGRFSLVYTAYLISFGLSQAAIGNVLMVRFGASDKDAILDKLAPCARSSVVLGLAAGGAIAMGFGVTGEAVVMAIIVAVSMPALLLQGVLRWWRYVEGEPRMAFLYDAVWAVGQLATYVVAWRTHHLSPTVVVVGWAIGAWFSAVVAAAPMTQLLLRRTGQRFLGANSRLTVLFTAEYMAKQLGNYGLPYFLLIFLDLAALGRIRGAQVMLGFISVPLMGLAPLFVKRATNIVADDPRKLTRHAIFVAFCGVAITLVYVGVLFVIPPYIGVDILGKVWRGAAPLMPAVGVGVATQWVLWAGTNGLHVRGDLGISIRLTTAAGVLTMAFAAVGAEVAGARGAVWGIAGAPLFVAPFAWWRLKERSELPPHLGSEEGWFRIGGRGAHFRKRRPTAPSVESIPTYPQQEVL